MFSNYGNTIMDRSGNIFHLGYSGVEKFSKLKFTIHYKNDNNNTLYGRIVGGTSGMGNSLPYSKPILDKKNNLLYINKKTISIFNTSTFSFKHISHDSVIRSVTKDSIYAKASRDSIKVLMKNSSQQKLQLEKIDHTISDKLYENIFGLYCKLNSTIVLSENKGTYFSMISQQNNLLVKLNYSGKVQPIYKATILGNEFIDDSKKDQLIIFSLDKIITVKDTVVKVNRMRLPSILYSSFSKELKGHLCLFNGGIGIYNYKKFDTIYFDEDTSNYSSGSNFAKYKNKTWIATRKYLFSIDHTTKKVAKIKLFDKKLVRDKVREVQLISNELFDRFDLTFYNKKALLSTQVSGLWIYDFTTSNWKTISLSDGLLDNKIVKMNVVKNEAFLIMDNGISVVDLKSYLIRNYRFDTPLNNKSGHLMENVWEQDFVFGNKILIPGDHSHYAFDLDKLNKIMPYVQLENLLINQSKPISNKNLFEQSKLTFSYNENDLSGTFVGIELSDPEQNKYAYRLKGFNNHWKVVSSKDRNFEFTNIPPGNYVLEIMASNNDGYWSEPYKLEIEILPPFWQTIWFRILIGLSIVLFLFLLYRWRTSAMRNRQKQLENTVHERTREVVHQKELIEEKQKEITDSINYAKRIQYSLLAHDDLLDKNLPEHFVLFKPKDIVSGDFYWATEKLAVDSGSKQFYLAVCDSTGHGVPGAFMSLLNISFLNEGINEKNIIEPNKVFDHVRNRLTENMDGGADGMDAILIQIDFEKKIMNYTAANNAPLLIRNNTIQELQKDKMPVGRSDKNNPFQLFNLTLEKGDCLYFYTDGYADQFGGEKGKKFKYANLNKLLMEIHQLPLSEQNEKLIVAFEKWRGDLEQVDDVCVIGIRI
jgi:serine phosphatase RsbU (regulator of sigma subunit)